MDNFGKWKKVVFIINAQQWIGIQDLIYYMKLEVIQHLKKIVDILSVAGQKGQTFNFLTFLEGFLNINDDWEPV